MRHFLVFLFFIYTSVLFSKSQTTHIAKLNLDTHAGAIQSMCLFLTSDKQKIITRSGKNIDIWNARDLKHLGRIKDAKHGWGCDLHKNDHYFLVRDLQGVILYDLQTRKQIKEFKKTDRKHGDSLMAASFSKDGNSINTYEHITVEPRLRKPFLFRYNITSGKRERIKAFPAQMNSNALQDDTLYTLDMHKNTSLTVYDIQTDTQRKGDAKDRQIYDSLHGWWDCRGNMSKTKICQIDNGIKYSLASGDLRRTELNASKKIEPKITFMQRKPLRKAYFYETEFKWPYLINKSTQQYYGWDISKGKQIWSIRQKLTISTEFDSVPNHGIVFFKHQDRAMIIAGFQGDVLDINTSSGIFHYVPKYKNEGSYITMRLSEDDQTLLLSKAKQMPPLDEYKFTFNTSSRELFPKHTAKNFKATSTKHLTHYTASYNGTDFILFRRKNNARIATFHNFENSEWLVMTPQGYFNASSYNVLVNILKNKKQKTTLENMQTLAKKWYRPDIIEAILSDKDFSSLENMTSTFILPLKAVDNNAFKKSIKEMITKDNRLDFLRLFKKNRSKDDIPFLFKEIENAKDQKTYDAYYETLTYYPFHMRKLKLKLKLKPFIESRIKTLNTHPLEQAPLLRYIYAKRGPKKKMTYILNITKGTTLTDEAKRVIAKRCKPETFKVLEPLLWKVWEEQFYVSPKVKSYLEKINPKRAVTAQIVANKQHEKMARDSIPKLYKTLLETKQYTRERNAIQRELANDFNILNDLNATANLSTQKEIAMANLDAFFKQTTFDPSTVTAYLKFMMKYGREMEKKILHAKIEIYILSFHSKNKKHNTYALNSFLKDYFPYQPEFVLQTMITLSQSPIRDVRSGISYHMRNFKDPKFVPILLKLLDFKDLMVSNHALGTLLQYNAPVIKQVIEKLNELKECSKISYLDITNSNIAQKVDKESYAKYRCGN